jgi:P4 family phage/plasmid primase-like protien
VEVRAPKTRWGTISGYFDDHQALENAIKKELDGRVAGVYCTLNPVRPDLLARASNRLEKYAKFTTADQDVLGRRWLPLDFDPTRPAGISATDAEHDLALERASEVAVWLREQGWPEGIFADSGNGGHLLYRIDLPNDDDSRDLIKRCLQSLAGKFSDDRVKVDTEVYNAARIWKVYGTLAAKGDSTTDRPHRRAATLEVPGYAIPVAQELLEELAAEVRAVPKGRDGSSSNGHRGEEFDLAGWIADHAPAVSAPKASAGGATTWEFDTCPWNSEHHRGEAFILQRANGAIAAGCRHESCRWDWHELRARYEPERTNPVPAPSVPGTDTDFEDEDIAPESFFETGEGFIPSRMGEYLEAQVPIRLGHDRRLWRYRDGVYGPDGDDWIKTQVRALLGEKFRRRHLDETLAWLRAALPELSERPPEAILNVRNGLLHWRTEELRPHSPDVFSTVQLDVTWEPGARCPLTEQFLAQAMPEDTADLAVEVAGYALYAGNPFQKAILFLGPGGNGKGVYTASVKNLIGADNYATVPLQALAENRSSGAELYGKLANICGDIDARANKRTDLFKQVTGGDSIYAERKFGHPFGFICFALPMFSANEAPFSSDQSDAWFDRWLVVPMERRFRGTPAEDPHLIAKLSTKAEKEGFLVLAVRGLQRLMERGRFAPSEAVVQAGDRYRERLDTVRAFIGEECTLDPDAWVDRAKLYQQYKSWCSNGGRFALSNATFNEHLVRGYGERVQPKKRRGRPGWGGLSSTRGDGGDEGDDFPPKFPTRAYTGGKGETRPPHPPHPPSGTNGTASAALTTTKCDRCGGDRTKVGAGSGGLCFPCSLDEI